jgi:CTP:molybdopterin cytidylyltransferase MocA
MGQPKAWLRLDGRTLLQRIVDAAVAGGAHAVVVVAGAEDDLDGEPTLVTRIDIATRVTSSEDVRMSVALGTPEGSLIDSIRAGYELVGEGSDVLLWPVDAPFADATLIAALAEALGARRDAIALPCVGETRCHPVLLGEKVAAELMTPAADEGAHSVIRRDAARIIAVAASDPRLGAALNTPADAEALGISLT